MLSSRTERRPRDPLSGAGKTAASLQASCQEVGPQKVTRDKVVQEAGSDAPTDEPGGMQSYKPSQSQVYLTQGEGEDPSPPPPLAPPSPSSRTEAQDECASSR